MKAAIALVLLLGIGITAQAQRPGGGQGGGRPGGQMGQGGGQMGQGAGAQTRQQQMDRNRSQTMDQTRIQQRDRLHQGPLTDKDTQRGSFRMMMQKTNMNAEQLRQMYDASGARNYGQFVSGVMAAHNLGLDKEQVLTRMRTRNLNQALQDMGVDKAKANQEANRVRQEMRIADMGTTKP